MTTSQRKVVLIVSILVAPVLFLAGIADENALLAFGGPILSLGAGIFVWVGRSKDAPSA
jgi:hypothetical protein